MAQTPLSMHPTGWFQVAWSSEITSRDVHKMKYFGREMVAWRAASGNLSVFDAYCEHLGAHLGYGGHVEGENLVCPFHGWEWNAQGRNVCVPYENHPNKVRRIRSYPVVERNEAVWIWYDVNQREPYFEVPDMFTGFGDDPGDADNYYPPVPAATLFRQGLELHPQYVMENGVDFAHFKFVHETPFMPEFTRHDFEGPVSYVDFTIAFEEGVTLETATSGVYSINAGLGCSITKSWGMIENRTMPAVTPVDDATCDVRFTVWIGRKPGDDSPEMSRYGKTMADLVIEQFDRDVEIWSHQRYSDPPALSRRELKGFKALREWAVQFYPDGGPAGVDPTRPESGAIIPRHPSAVARTA
ncbi:Rieske 2Fe-2S domain-containing protein [Gordonia sp. NPDC003585]|uniref:Rieske 2Fe-2S domain-containing protein n=1 Tax=Gordonia sp. NPDC003585 TaxID=3154275 RepID=UPI0033B53D2B